MPVTAKVSRVSELEVRLLRPIREIRADFSRFSLQSLQRSAIVARTSSAQLSTTWISVAAASGFGAR